MTRSKSSEREFHYFGLEPQSSKELKIVSSSLLVGVRRGATATTPGSQKRGGGKTPKRPSPPAYAGKGLAELIRNGGGGGAVAGGSSSDAGRNRRRRARKKSGKKKSKGGGGGGGAAAPLSKATADNGKTAAETLRELIYSRMGVAEPRDLEGVPEAGGDGRKGSKPAGAGLMAASPGVVTAASALEALEMLTMNDIYDLQPELENLLRSVNARIQKVTGELGELQTGAGGSSQHANVNPGVELTEEQRRLKRAAAEAKLINDATQAHILQAAEIVMRLRAQLEAPRPSFLTPPPSAAAESAASPTKSGLARKKLQGEGVRLGRSFKRGGAKHKPPPRATHHQQRPSHLVSPTVAGTVHHVSNQPEAHFSGAPFLAPSKGVTLEDVATLERMLSQPLVAPVAGPSEVPSPPLGKHYRDEEGPAKWNYIAEERGAGGSRAQVIKLNHRAVASLFDEKNERRYLTKEDASPGPSASSSSSAASGGGNPEGRGSVHGPGLASLLRGLDGSELGLGGGASCSSGSAVMLGSRLRETLDQAFVLEADIREQLEKDPPGDEAEAAASVAKIKRSSSTLAMLQQCNAQILQRFLSRAKRQLRRQALAREVEEADREMIAAYQVIGKLRVENKPIPQGDKDLAFDAMEKRNKALQKLEEYDRAIAMVMMSGLSSEEAAPLQ